MKTMLPRNAHRCAWLKPRRGPYKHKTSPSFAVIMTRIYLKQKFKVDWHRFEGE